MYLAWREVKHAKLRYLLIGVVLMLISWLVFLLSGLANGLATDNGAALKTMKSDELVFQANTKLYIHRSLLPHSMVDEVNRADGVKAVAPLGQLTVTVTKTDGSQQIDATVLATDPDSFLMPKVVEGNSLTESGEAYGIVVDKSFKEYGIRIGDKLHVLQSDQIYTIVGFVSGQKYNHLPVIFMDIPHWQSLRFPTDQSAMGIADPVSVIAVQLENGANADAIRKLPNVEVVNNATALRNLPGYKEEAASVNMMLVFLFIIAAFVLAVFFYVLTLQKSNQFGVLKAIGAKTSYLVRNLLGQVMLLAIAGIVVGAALTYAVAAAMPNSVPFALSNGWVVKYGVVLLVVSFLGTLLSLRKIAKVDPLEAIGRSE